MPFFYLLSGFVMGLRYGEKLIALPSSDTDDGDDSDKCEAFDKKTFWRNRFARLAPVYFYTNVGPAVTMILLALVGMMQLQPSQLAGMLLFPFGLTSWFVFTPPPNGVCWTISTMMFFYVVFPYILPRIQQWSKEKQKAWIGGFYGVQIVTWVFIGGLFSLVSQDLGYWMARAWPPSRLPVFLMGVLAALHRNRELSAGIKGESSPSDVEGQADQKSESWSGWFCCCGDCCTGGGERANAGRADRSLAAYIFMVLFCVCLDYGLGLANFVPRQGVMVKGGVQRCPEFKAVLCFWQRFEPVWC